MDRRKFIKKTALATAGLAGAAITSPVSAMLKQNETVQKKVKVLMLNGSPRADGNTFCCLKEIEKQLQKHGVETEIVQIGQNPVRMCINCGGCRDGEGCVFDDDLCNVIAKKMEASDALIMGTPVYYGQPNGGILSLMQRLFFSAGHLVQNKPAAALAVCRRGGATATLQTMNMMFEMMNMPVVTSQYWNIAYGAGKGEVKRDTEGMQTMRTLANNMAWLLENIHANGKAAPQREERPVFMNFIR
ncbi:MAG: flavodoxin family protein [Prevotella sp.]|nr:flavodoxin family protein [Prevotella sp.]